MGETCSTKKMKIAYEILVEKMKGRDHLGRLNAQMVG
jgi:hypothetical protein